MSNVNASTVPRKELASDDVLSPSFAARVLGLESSLDAAPEQETVLELVRLYSVSDYLESCGVLRN